MHAMEYGQHEARSRRAIGEHVEFGAVDIGDVLTVAGLDRLSHVRDHMSIGAPSHAFVRFDTEAAL
jgi:hypothetical protein